MAEAGTREGRPVLAFAGPDEWRDWLTANGQSSDGVWLKLARKSSGVASVTHDEALDVALCFGWIDARAQSLDHLHWVQRFCPRRPRSTWSKINRARAERLIDEGLMQPAGLLEVERARADGRWDAAYDAQSVAQVPEDLAAALDAEPAARRFFEALDSRNRYSILHRIQTAKRPETRARRIADFAAMCARGEKIHP